MLHIRSCHAQSHWVYVVVYCGVMNTVCMARALMDHQPHHHSIIARGRNTTCMDMVGNDFVHNSMCTYGGHTIVYAHMLVTLIEHNMLHQNNFTTTHAKHPCKWRRIC
jgi:hypothetical protein